MTTCFRLTRVRSVTIRMEHTEEAVGFLPRHLVVQEQAGVDISHYRNRNMAAAHIVWQSILVEAITNQLPHLESLIIDLSGPHVDFSLWTRSQPLSDYLTSKIGGLHLRNICARTLRLQLQGPPLPSEWGPQNREYIPQGTFYYWSCLDDTAVDFVKTTTKDALVLDVFVTSLPGGKIPPAIFDHMTRRLTFNTNTKIAGLEGLLLEKCGELGMFCEGEVEEKEIAAADTILTVMSSRRCGLDGYRLDEVTMRKVVK